MQTTLLSLREHIEDIDSSLHTLLEQRDCYVRDIAHVKKNSSMHLFDPQRESMLYAQYTKEYIPIIKEVIAHSRTLQGLVCYVIRHEDILYAKLALGCASRVELCPSYSSSQHNPLTTLFYVPQDYVETMHGLYSQAMYSIISSHTCAYYHAMTIYPQDTPIEFSVHI